MELMLPKRAWEDSYESLPNENGITTKWDKPKWFSHEPTLMDTLSRKRLDILYRRRMGWKKRSKL